MKVVRRTAGDVTRDPEVAELPGKVRLVCTQLKQRRDWHDEHGDGQISDGQTDDEVVGHGAQASIADDGSNDQTVADERQQDDREQRQ